MPRIRARPQQASDRAILVLRSADNPVPDGGGKWLAGEIVQAFPADHEFGFLEIPVDVAGFRTVAEVNALNPENIGVYDAAKMSDSGTITIGANAPLEVQQNDVIVWHYSGLFVNYGDRTSPNNRFYHIIIEDRTVSEVQVYLEAFNKKLSYESDAFDPTTERRRWTTTNIRVSATGKNGFTADGIQNAIDTWNADYPENQVTLLDTDNLTYMQVENPEGFSMPNDKYDEWRTNTQQVALADYYRRRRWYITQSGLDALAANDGVLEGPASAVASYLRDGLLD